MGSEFLKGLKNNLILLLLALSLSGCQGLRPFDSFLEKLPTINLPLKGENCSVGLDAVSPHKFTNEELQLRPKSCHVYGKVPTDFGHALMFDICGDYFHPHLFTYNKDGVKLDSLKIGQNCGSDALVEQYSSYSITTDWQIIVVDSTIYYGLDQSDLATDSFTSVVVAHSSYQVNSESGEIIKLEN